MNFEIEIEKALRSKTPSLSLRSFLQDLLDNGEMKEKILQNLTEYRKKLFLPSQEREDDILLDMMDYVAGWCSPHMNLGGRK
jgi:hypothetical protein